MLEKGQRDDRKEGERGRDRMHFKAGSGVFNDPLSQIPANLNQDLRQRKARCVAVDARAADGKLRQRVQVAKFAQATIEAVNNQMEEFSR